MINRFEGKVAIITGGGKGIGKAAAIRLATEGCDIVCVTKSLSGKAVAEEITEYYGRESLFIQADVSKEESANYVVESVMNKFGKIDHLFNNAGITGVHNTELRDYDPVEFLQVMQTNVASQYYFMKAVLPYMEPGSSILNCSSLHGNIGMGGDAAYSASKHAVIGLTKSVAIEEAKRGIRVNAYCPGLTETELLSDYITGLGGNPEDTWKLVESMNPMNRRASAEEHAAYIAFLLSNEASFVTNSVILCDGGHLYS